MTPQRFVRLHLFATTLLCTNGVFCHASAQTTLTPVAVEDIFEHGRYFQLLNDYPEISPEGIIAFGGLALDSPTGHRFPTTVWLLRPGSNDIESLESPTFDVDGMTFSATPNSPSGTMNDGSMLFAMSSPPSLVATGNTDPRLVLYVPNQPIESALCSDLDTSKTGVSSGDTVAIGLGGIVTRLYKPDMLAQLGADGKLRCVTTTSGGPSVIPGAEYYSYATVVSRPNVDGAFVYDAILYDDEELGITASNDEILVAYVHDSEILLARERALAPGVPDAIFRGFFQEPTIALDEGIFLFAAYYATPDVPSTQTGIWQGIPGNLTPLVTVGTPAFGFPGETFSSVASPTSNSTGSIAFFGRLKHSDAVDGTNDQVLWYAEPGPTSELATRLEPILREGDRLPFGGEPELAQFTSDGMAMNGRGDLLFHARLRATETGHVTTANDEALLLYMRDEHEVHLVVREGDVLNAATTPGVINLQTIETVTLSIGNAEDAGLPYRRDGSFNNRGEVVFHADFKSSTPAGRTEAIIVARTRPACSTADLAAPWATLNFADVQAFLGAFNTQSPAADLAAPTGVFNFADVQAYLGAFNTGC